ncbi:MAG: hypothetical protein LBM77_05620 [Spirochaetaceae bacterium]|nr:hypothetical protein [Spirochaetaceae bacterium]
MADLFKSKGFFIGTVLVLAIMSASCEMPSPKIATLTGEVTITGTPKVGETLTADTTELEGEGLLAYQWIQGEDTKVGSGGSTYVPLKGDIGQTIKVQVSRVGYDGTVESSPTTVVLARVLSGSVSILGNPIVGSTLTADTSQLSGTGTITYQWMQGEDTTVGTGGNTYVPVEGDIGKTIKVQVSRVDYDGTVESSPTTAVLAATKILSGSVIISGNPIVGSTLTADTSQLSGTGTITYQWIQGESSLIGTGTSSYVPVEGDIGKSIKVRVSCEGYEGTIESSPTAVVLSATKILSGSVSISGNPIVGSTLTADTSQLSGTGTITCQWIQGESSLIGTGASSYVPVEGDIGKTIKVRVSREGYEGTIMSNPTISVTRNLQLVTNLDLTDLVPVPRAGLSPSQLVNTIDTTEYSSTIMWSRQDGLVFSPTTAFQLYISYKAIVELSPKAGYTFEGIGTNTFTHSEAVSVSNEENRGTVTIIFNSLEPIKVTALDLTSLVTPPVKGELASNISISTGQYTGSVSWRTSGGSSFSSYFDAGTIYRAVVTLSAATGYTFNGVEANSFTYTGATSVSNSANSGTVTIVFPATVDPVVVTTLDLSSLIIAPVKGASPNTASISTEQYTGFVNWSRNDENYWYNSSFEANTVYKAMLTLTPHIGYTFTGVSANAFSYTGATSVTNSANSGTVMIVFPVTTKNNITQFDLTNFITRPAIGQSPSSALSQISSEFSGNVSWLDGNDLMVSGSFIANTTYKAIVTLTPTENYTFNTVAANSFINTNAMSVSNNAGSNVITITFPKIVSADLDGLIMAPVVGEIPVTTPINTTQYTGTVSWKEGGGSLSKAFFRGSKTYSAMLSFTVKNGYTFVGIPANYFTYTGSSVSNNANSGNVTVIFPQTDPITARLYVNDSTTPAYLGLGVVSNLNNILPWIKNNATSNSTYLIKLFDSDNVTAKNLDNLNNANNVSITFTGMGEGSIEANWPTVQLSGTGSLLTIGVASGNSVSVILNGKMLLKGVSSNNASLVKVNATGQLELNGSVKIAGNIYSENNYSGGIIIIGRSTTYGGGIYVDGGSLTMNDNAVVSGNTASSDSSDDDDYTSYSYGAGVYVASGTFSMNDNAIVSGNTALSSSYSYGGGVYVASGTFSMNDNAVVSGNIASSLYSIYGGGVYVESGTFNMNDNAAVSGNTVYRSSSLSSNIGGGAIYLAGGTFNMADMAIVSGNKTVYGSSSSIAGYGGGVYIESGVAAVFSKTGGVIYGSSESGNDASGTPKKNQSSDGAAIYIDGSHYKNNHITEDMDMSYDYNAGSPLYTGLWVD